MQVYIIVDEEREILGATLSKDKAKEILKEYADLETVFMDRSSDLEGYEIEYDEDELNKEIESEFEEWVGYALKGDDTDSIYGVWCEVVELEE